MNVFWPLTTGISLLGNMVGMAIEPWKGTRCYVQVKVTARGH